MTQQAIEQLASKPDAVSIPSISSSAMLTELSISVWTARKKDNKASNDVTRQNHADAGAANVTKHLLGRSKELDAIGKYATQIRAAHYAMTMPWSDSGMRLLPTANYFEYHKTMTGMRDVFEALVHSFLKDYQWEVSKAHAKLGELFNASEYPTAEQVTHRFGFHLNYTPLPDAGDFRIDVGEEATAALKAQYEGHAQAMYAKAMDDVWGRLHDSLSALTRSLMEPEVTNPMGPAPKARRIYDSVFDKVLSLIGMLSSCNITDDPRMEEMKTTLEAALRGVSTDALKHSPTLREETRSKLDAAIAALPSLE